MGKYLIIESRDPFDSRDTERFHDVAQGLVENGNEVTLFMVQNGVLPARRESTYARRLSDLGRSKVTLLADSLSLGERGIGEEDLLPGIESTDIRKLVDLLMTDDNLLEYNLT